MVIVDSSVWIDFLNRKVTPQTRWLHAVQGERRIGLTILLLAEVLQGIRFESRFQEVERYFFTMPVFDVLGAPLAVQSARNFRTLRGLGVTIRSTIDCLTATFCIEQGHRLLHKDVDFDHFERHLGLNVLHP